MMTFSAVISRLIISAILSGVLSLVMVSCLAPTVYAQGGKGACMQMLRDIYKKAQGGGDKIYYANYTVRTVASINGKTTTSETTMELLTSDTRMQVVSKEMEVYQDAGSIITVVPANKTINLAKSDLKSFRESRGKSLAALRDTFLMISDIQECADVTDKSFHTDKRVTLKLRPGAERMLGISTVTMYIDTRNQEIRKAVIKPSGGGRVSSIEITFNRVDYDYQTSAFNRPIAEQFMSHQGTLLPRYQGYTLVDSRTKSPRR